MKLTFLILLLSLTSCYKIEKSTITNPKDEVCLKSITNVITNSLNEYHGIEFKTRMGGLSRYIEGMNDGRHKYLNYDLRNGKQSIHMKFLFSSSNDCELVLVHSEFNNGKDKTIAKDKSSGLSQYPVKCICQKKRQ